MEKNNRLKRGIVVYRLVLLLLSILAAAVVYVWLTSFGGEFLIIFKRKWALVTFAALLVLNSVLGFAALFIKREKPFILPEIIRVGLAIWNPVAGVMLLYIFSKLVMWVIDTMAVYELAVLSLPFIGYGALLIIDGAAVIFSLVRKRSAGIGLPGMAGAGVSFLFVFGVFSITLAFWNPSYAPGLKPEVLFSPGMQKGREYRIPSMLTFKDGAGRDIVLAFAESRADAMFDWGDIDLVMRRSEDGGRTWGPIKVLVDAEKRTAGNPCPVFDRDTKTLWLPYCIDNKQVWMMKSVDFGVTFSKPYEITKQLGLEFRCKDVAYCLEYGTGPGIGIQLENSRLVIPAYFMGPSIEKGAHVIYSDDHGATWKKGSDIGAGEEPQAFQRSDGALDINCRTKICRPRLTGLSRDGGQSWPDVYPDPALVCAETQASIIKYPGGGKTVLFSNPSGCARGNMTVRLSEDDGKTWPFGREIFNGPSCYSQLCILPDGGVLLLLEAGKYDYREGLALVRFDSGFITGRR